MIECLIRAYLVNIYILVKGINLLLLRMKVMVQDAPILNYRISGHSTEELTEALLKDYQTAESTNSVELFILD